VLAKPNKKTPAPDLEREGEGGAIGKFWLEAGGNPHETWRERGNRGGIKPSEARHSTLVFY